jgi:hypothetical protein
MTPSLSALFPPTFIHAHAERMPPFVHCMRRRPRIFLFRIPPGVSFSFTVTGFFFVS